MHLHEHCIPISTASPSAQRLHQRCTAISTASPSALHVDMPLQVRKQLVILPSFRKLPNKEQQAVLHIPHMQHLTHSVSSDGALAVAGDMELVAQVMGCNYVTSIHIHSKLITCACT